MRILLTLAVLLAAQVAGSPLALSRLESAADGSQLDAAAPPPSAAAIAAAAAAAAAAPGSQVEVARLDSSTTDVDVPVDPGCSVDFPCSGGILSLYCYAGKCPATGTCNTGHCSCGSDASCVGAWYGALSTPVCSNCGSCSTVAYFYGCDGGAIAGTVVGGIILLILVIVLTSVYAPCCRCCYSCCSCCCCCCASCAPAKAPAALGATNPVAAAARGFVDQQPAANRDDPQPSWR